MRIDVMAAVGTINDQTSSHRLNLIIGGLCGLGAFMVGVTVWLWRGSRPVPPHLEGLDLLPKRRWLHAQPERRADLLGEIRTVRGTAVVAPLIPDPQPVAPAEPLPLPLTADATSSSAPVVAPLLVGAQVEASPALPQPVVPPFFAQMMSSGLPQPATATVVAAKEPAAEAGYGDPHE